MQRINVNQGLKKVPFSSPGQVDFLARPVTSCKAYLPWADPGIFDWWGGGGGVRVGGDPNFEFYLLRMHPRNILLLCFVKKFVQISLTSMLRS